ncbi:ABC transporter ATP-binding protein [Marinobacterium sp. AK62]|uniref:ABC transporter ATP-binding protein n=1 Tax=Marinobacterium alkalitolerans TaxID=1542925 RepID=A0ABS3ZDF2_9GAMM|nr:ABC transporter ATP-binding protein [Marinobacterium alkalitolerans]MBP0049720.1 ABC transporter ATP-binding protein [Marinobacterium alkalitolerans]
MGAVRVSDIGKAYRQYPSRWARLKEWLIPGQGVRHELHWVLRGVSFEVRPGEAVGVIGVNGAGKSTLLKLITGVSHPTEGSVEVVGRVSAMLELGMGFHPDFTGRENVIMAGQLLGFSARTMADLMPSIEEFAEIGEYIDQPVRVYSSGMQMRLAFSVATVQRPDLLIVDEALSVGDAYFQHKSFQRIREYRDAGTTLLMVSHDKGAIQSICDRALLLDGGRIAMEGDPESVMDYYNALLARREDQNIDRQPVAGERVQTRSGNGAASILKVQLLGAKGEPVENVKVGQEVSMRVQVRVDRPLPELVVGFLIKDRLGQPVFGTNTHHLGKSLTELPAGRTLAFQFNFCACLGAGHYAVSVALHTADNHLENNFDWLDMALMFNVISTGVPEFSGVAWLPTEVDVEE